MKFLLPRGTFLRAHQREHNTTLFCVGRRMTLYFTTMKKLFSALLAVSLFTSSSFAAVKPDHKDLAYDDDHKAQALDAYLSSSAQAKLCGFPHTCLLQKHSAETFSRSVRMSSPRCKNSPG